MKTINLTQGQVALVDDADYNWLNQWKWCALKHHSGSFYAVRSSLLNNKHHLIPMARQILGLKYGDKRQADHIDHNPLDNCRNNLRICTRRENQRNQKPQKNVSSEFKGVSWNRGVKKWQSYIKINGKKKHLGYWIIEELAALAYDMVAIREHGEFACLNFN